MKVFVLLLVAGATIATKECGKNQHYNPCGTACPSTCENYQDPPKACILLCVPGCHCDEGFVIKANDECVRPDKCASGAGDEKGTCSERPDGGPCEAYIPMFYYDPKTQSCKEFIFGGCEGNGNRYASEEECIRNCKGVAMEAKSICRLHPNEGLCKGFFPRYYFNEEARKCKRFIYGGCGGNRNNFETEYECNRTCGKSDDEFESFCDLPADVGSCKGFFPRYYFDKKSGKCNRFIYGGCEGNRNNFETEYECNRTCGRDTVDDEFESFCDLPTHAGSCKGFFPRYYFDKKSGKCKLFIFGGCGGNRNNFETEHECNRTCVKT